MREPLSQSIAIMGIVYNRQCNYSEAQLHHDIDGEYSNKLWRSKSYADIDLPHIYSYNSIVAINIVYQRNTSGEYLIYGLDT